MNIEVMTDEFDDTDTRFETVKNDKKMIQILDLKQ